VRLKVRADFASNITANMVVLRVPMPKTTTRYADLQMGPWNCLSYMGFGLRLQQILSRQIRGWPCRLLTNLVGSSSAESSSVLSSSVFWDLWARDRHGRVSFVQEEGAAGQTTDFKESTKVIEWCCRKVSSNLSGSRILSLLRFNMIRHSTTEWSRLGSVDMCIACACSKALLG
jgi:hypothetical protein